MVIHSPKGNKMTTYNIKDMVSNQKKVTFVMYRKGELWYRTECGFDFPVPVSDTGDASFMNEDKALLFMRWINQQIKAIKAGQVECQAV